MDLSLVGLATAFMAGTISFLSPCVLPLVPAYVSYVAGHSVVDPDSSPSIARRFVTASLSLCFVLGFSTVFILLGASATALGQLLAQYRYELNIAAGLLVMLFGFFMLGVVNFGWLQRDVRFRYMGEGAKPMGAYLLGLAFGFGWTPCIGPVLGAILATAAMHVSIAQGVILLAVYALGLGLPFVLAALFTDLLTEHIKAVGSLGRSLKLGAGLVMIVMGLAMITGQLAIFAYWLLDAVPALGNIG